MSLVLLREKSASSRTPKGLCTWVNVNLEPQCQPHGRRRPDCYRLLIIIKKVVQANKQRATYTDIQHPDGEREFGK